MINGSVFGTNGGLNFQLLFSATSKILSATINGLGVLRDASKRPAKSFESGQIDSLLENNIEKFLYNNILLKGWVFCIISKLIDLLLVK